MPARARLGHGRDRAGLAARRGHNPHPRSLAGRKRAFGGARPRLALEDDLRSVKRPRRCRPERGEPTRRAAEFHVDPEDAHVSVDGRPIGVADDWDGVGGGKSYAFDAPGVYRIELSLAGYRTAWVKIVVAPDAREDVVDVDTELAEIEE